MANAPTQLCYYCESSEHTSQNCKLGTNVDTSLLTPEVIKEYDISRQGMLQVGDKAPDISTGVYDLDSEKTVSSLFEKRGKQPLTVLNFGSYS
mmetsp:Transcript_15107/g.22626  ORF Transcript_15107/g.22626 Transcript_15107/m.22626 type:complete len:93 (-) Transcript_15107:382-660(-)